MNEFVRKTLFILGGVLILYAVAAFVADLALLNVFASPLEANYIRIVPAIEVSFDWTGYAFPYPALFAGAVLFFIGSITALKTSELIIYHKRGYYSR